MKRGAALSGILVLKDSTPDEPGERPALSCNVAAVSESVATHVS